MKWGEPEWDGGGGCQMEVRYSLSGSNSCLEIRTLSGCKTELPRLDGSGVNDHHNYNKLLQTWEREA